MASRAHFFIRFMMAWPLLLALSFGGRPACAENFVTDISEDVIAINSSFTGRTLVLFGAINQSTESLVTTPTSEGELNIVVVVRGPHRPIVARRKTRVAGIWVNTQSVELKGVPAFYYVSSHKVFDSPEFDRLLSDNEIGMGNIRIRSENTQLSNEEIAEFREAIVRQKQKDSLYREEFGGLSFIEQTLFRTQIKLPARVPVGAYSTEVFLIRGATVVSAQTKPFYINKTGIGRTVYEFAYDHPFFYGAGAVLIALFAGWLASVIFRKD